MKNLAFMISMLFVVAGCSAEKNETKQETLADRVLNVKVTEAKTRTFEELLKVQGSLEAKDSATVAARVSGPLLEVCVDVGDVVEKDKTILFKVDATELENRVLIAKEDIATAKAGLAVAEANEKRARVDFDKAERDAARYTRLYEQKLVTDNEYEQAVVKRDAAAAQLAITEANILHSKQQISQAEAMLKIAERNLADATIYAPISGVVNKRFREPGERVDKGTEIVNITGSGSVEAIAFLPSFYYSKIVVGETEVALKIDGADIGRFKVTAKSPAIDMKLRTFEVRALVNDNSAAIPGSLAEFNFVISSKQAIGVPDSAVLNRAAGDLVFVQNDDVAKETLVSTGLRNNGFVELTSGVNDGDKIVVEGQTQLYDGRKVSVVE